MPDTVPPTVPANVTATATSSTAINVSWAASTDNVGVTGYRVERCQGAGCTAFTQVSASTTTGISGPLTASPANPRHFLEQQCCLRDALCAALTLDTFNRHADKVAMANVAQMINVLQAIILTDKEKMILTPTYYVFKMYVPFQDATFLPVAASTRPPETQTAASHLRNAHRVARCILRGIQRSMERSGG